MGDFAPSLEASKAKLGSSTPIVTRPHPDGPAGAKVSLDDVAKRVVRGSTDVLLLGWAGRALTHKAGCPFIPTGKPDRCTCGGGRRPKTVVDQAQAILDAFRAQTVYTGDPVNVELIRQPRQMLCLDDKLCMPAGDCDDGVVTVGSAMLGIGVPVKVIGQSFSSDHAITHVICAVYDQHNDKWYRIDPSSEFAVGDYFPPTDEVWIDPMDPQISGLGEGGRYVGIGSTPIVPGMRPCIPSLVGNDIKEYLAPRYWNMGYSLGGVGQTPQPSQLDPQTQQAIFDGAISTLQAMTFKLDKSLIELKTAKTQANQTRGLLDPNNTYDPEPTSFSIASIADFPVGSGMWTRSMDVICDQLISIGDTVSGACHEAQDGVRRLLVDPTSQSVYIESSDSDPWALRTAVKTATDAVLAFYDKASNILSGFTAKAGQVLSASQIQQLIGSSSSGTLGAPRIITIFGYTTGWGMILELLDGFIVAKQMDAAASAAKEATYQSIVNAVVSGKLTTDQGKTLIQATSDARVKEAEAQAKVNESDPFAKLIGDIGKIVSWMVVGGVVVAGIVIGFPFLKEGVSALTEGMRARRLKAGMVHENGITGWAQHPRYRVGQVVRSSYYGDAGHIVDVTFDESKDTWLYHVVRMGDARRAAFFQNEIDAVLEHNVWRRV